MEHLKKYILLVLMCLLCVPAKSAISWQPIKLIHYDGCVNIGVPDTLLLRVDDAKPNSETKGYYVWSIPDTWKPIGCVTCKELKVVTYETEAATRVYRVGTLDNSKMYYAYDTVQVRGADTSVIIWEDIGEIYCAAPNSFADLLEDDKDAFDFLWYKGRVHPDSVIFWNFGINLWVASYLFNGAPPVLAYRPKSGCWSVTDQVVTFGELSLELQGQGQVRVHSGITYCEVDTPGKTPYLMGKSEVLHFEVQPAQGYYLDRVEIGNGEQMRVVAECDIEEKDGVFSFRDFPKWMDDFTTEDYRVVLKEGEKKNAPVCEDTVKLAHYDGCVNIGMESELLLRIENPLEGLRYHWQIPAEWEPIGDTNGSELRVITHETKDTTRIYGVKFADFGPSLFDTVQVKGADTTLIILDEVGVYWATPRDLGYVEEDAFEFFWYKGCLHSDSVVSGFVVEPGYRFNGTPPVLAYRPIDGCWSVTDEVVVLDSVYPIRLVHYDVCVNIGVPDTILLRVENADERVRYHWQLPNEWEPIGDTDRGELRVITHETKDTTRIYGVRFATNYAWDDTWNIWRYDTVQVKGADTTLYITFREGRCVSINDGMAFGTLNHFDFAWYKGNLTEENWIAGNSSWISKSQLDGQKPLLKYRIKGNNTCWSATDEVIHVYRRLKVEIVGNGHIRVYSGRIYADVTKEGKFDGPVDGADTLRFVVKPSKGFYLDRIEIEDDEQVTVVSEEKIKEEADGTFLFRSSATWQDNKPHIDSISKENFRFIFTEKQHTLKDFGEHTVCWGDSVKMRDYYVRQSGWHYDTVAGEKAKEDTVYQLYLHVNPTYQDTLYFLAERDSLPYILGKDTIRQFGWTALKALTVHGCDSITYVRLDTLYIHREQHFYDTLHTCEGGVLSWRGREITQTGDNADTVFDPYRGGTDSIHHLRADIYPTYKEVVHRAAVERDSMPYIYGKDTIRNFGLTELHRYQTVHGCDSITYVQLEPVYRDEHIYDTVRGCGVAQFRWQGVVMIVYRGGDYLDSVEHPDRGGAKTYHHLHVEISFSQYTDFSDSCYIEELPYEVAGRPIPSYGTHIVNLVSEKGCDSVCEYSLSRRWHWYRVQVRVRGEGFVNVTDTVLREDASMWLAFSASPCYRLARLTVNGRAVSPQDSCELKDLHGDCSVEVTFASMASAETRVEMRACVDSLPVRYRGVDYGAGEHEIVLRNAAGCDSVVRIYVEGLENRARIGVLDTIAPPCNTSEIAFSYRTEEGTPKWLRLAFDPAALSAGFRDTVLAVGSTGGVSIALPASVRPDRYGLRLWQADGTGCYVAEDALNFEIPYPSDIIVQKWNDVLAVLSSEYNGGYEFSGYQWYKNGEPMMGETRSYLYVKPYLRSTDTYAVMLERASDGLRLQSCGVKRKSYPRGFSLELAPNPTTSGEAVQVSVNGKPDAEGTIEVFDGTGKPVYQKAFRRSHTLRLSVQPGSYVVRVRNAKNSWTATGKLVIR